jgi:hypothetical protein
MEVQYLYKFLTLSYQKVSHLDSNEDIMNLWPNLADEKEVKMGPYQEKEYTIYRAPGSRLIVSKDIELFYVGTKEFFIVCLVSDNRVSYWKMSDLLSLTKQKPFSMYFNYDNFMYWPKYKSLANLIYNMYNNEDSDWQLVAERPWKLFKSHMAFSPDCVIGETGESCICTIELCCSVYGEYDDEELTTTILWDQKPWEADKCYKVPILKHKINIVKEAWNIIKSYAYAGGNILRIEEFLCNLRNPFIDEGYKFVEIALNMNDLVLYEWAVQKYKLDKKRLMQWVNLFPHNDITRKIRGI